MIELDTLVPAATSIEVGGETLILSPLKVGQLPAFLRAINPVMTALTQPAIDWLALFAEHGEEVLTAVSIAVGKPRAWVDELNADEAVLLAARVLEVNADFFTRTVMPKLGQLIAPGAEKTVAPDSGSTPSRA